MFNLSFLILLTCRVIFPGCNVINFAFAESVALFINALSVEFRIRPKDNNIAQ